MGKKLLIACYFFPPCPSIGGRRSAKFAKYLAKEGDEIHVIQAKNPFPGESPWNKDITNPNIFRYELPLNYPKEFIVAPETITGKIRYRLWDYFFKIFYPGKNKFDYTIFWKKQYQAKAEELITRHQIKNVLVSGPPFYYAHHTVQLKKKFPDLKVIIDFRDPWIDSPYYGMSALKARQQEYEISVMNEVFAKADFFIGPNIFLLNKQLQFITPGNKKGAAVVEIPHAFDFDEVSAFLEIASEHSSTEKIKLIYGGQLYPGTDEILIAFSKVLDLIKEQDRHVYDKLQIDFYTPEIRCEKFFRDHPAIVKFYPPVGNKIMEKISQATFCMIFLAEHNKDFKTTKFLEYSVLRRPFIVMGNKGYVAEFVEENKIGKAFDAGSMNELKDLLVRFSKIEELGFNRDFDLTEYSFEKVTKKLRSCLK
jgi:hypothetical protein